MLVKQLIEQLQSENQEAIVVLAGDPEGDSFSLIDELDPTESGAWNTVDNEFVRVGVLLPSDIPAVCLWPL